MTQTNTAATPEQRQAAAQAYGVQVGQIVRLHSSFYGLCCDAKVIDVFMNCMEVQFEDGARVKAVYSAIYRKEA